ncbi:MAG: hypothetical protein KC431_04950, partial [Myxococcales bacterium]|nr:hypothetical protein [Myxococcales bacterium]
PSWRTQVCARKGDAVYCGESASTTLHRVLGLPAAVELACDGPRSCVRDGEDHLWCWLSGQPPEQLAEPASITAAIDGCVLGKDGVVGCAVPAKPASAAATYAPLQPFDDPELALQGVQVLMPGSTADHGCVVQGGVVRCWDGDDALPVEIAKDTVAEVAGLSAPGIDALALWSGRLCAHANQSWTCVAGSERWSVAGCEDRPCGCSLIGSARLSCEHEPHDRLDIRPVGRIADVTAVADPCAALTDGRVFCRGVVANQDPVKKAPDDELAGGLPGVGHFLTLSDEPAPAPAQPQNEEAKTP